MSSNLKVNTIQPSSGDTVSIAGIASITSSVSIASSCTATTFYGDGSNLTGVSGLSVGNQADNRLIPCTGTTDTLYGESNLTFASNVLTLSGTFNVSGEVQIAENIVHTGDGNTAIGFPANDTIRCITAGVERLRVDSSGRVLIGTTTEGESTADDLTIATSGTTGMTIRSGTSGEGNIFFSDGTSGAAEYAGTIQYSHASNYMLFFTGAAERVRINSSGHFLVGVTGSPSTNGFAVLDTYQSTTYLQIAHNVTGAEYSYFNFNHNGSTIGTIKQNNAGNAISFNTSSDYRLKENVVSISDGITRLKTLKPSRFNFKNDTGTTVDGFLAHEVTAVPEAITGTKDEVDSDNNPVYQGIDQSKLVPLLTAALQEAITKIETLEAKVSALEGS